MRIRRMQASNIIEAAGYVDTLSTCIGLAVTKQQCNIRNYS